MPKEDGTGPDGSGPINQGRRSFSGGGRGRGGGNRPGSGPGGNCVCPGCGAKQAHQQGTPCNSISCPQCGTAMVKE